MKKELFLLMAIMFLSCFAEDEDPPTVINGLVELNGEIQLEEPMVVLVGSRPRGDIFSPGQGAEEVWDREYSINDDGTFLIEIDVPSRVTSIRLLLFDSKIQVLYECQPSCNGIFIGQENDINIIPERKLP